MYKSIIVAIAETVITSCGISLKRNLSFMIKKHKIKKQLREQIQNQLLKKHGNEVYYNSLDSFLTDEDFASKMISYCNDPESITFKTIHSYLDYLLEKFIEKKHQYISYKSCISHDLLLLSRLIFSTYNDYSKNETARLVIVNFIDALGELSNEIFEKIEKIDNKIDKLLGNNTHNSEADLNNEQITILYKSSFTSYYSLASNYIERNLYCDKDIPQSSIDCLINNKRIVLLGEPGSGKTIEAISILKQVCTNDLFSKNIPIYIKLMEYGKVFNSIRECIKQQLYYFYGDISDDQLTIELSTDRFVLILDGVDEILNNDYRLIFFADINKLLSTSKAYFYITSRINPYHGDINNIREYRISSLSPEQIKKEFQNNGIETKIDNQYYELFANPLFLNLGIKVLKNTNTKIYNKSQLLNAYIEEVCYKRDRSKKIGDSYTKNYYRILMSIGKLAFDTFGKACLSISEFDEFFEKENKDYTHNNICDIFRIDVFNVQNSISFSHKQFKEFFAAYYLIKEFNLENNIDYYHSFMAKEEWQEVMVFAAGLIADIDVQNMFLDMMESINLKTYINCIKYKNDLSKSYDNLSHEAYSKKYLTVLYNSYITLINNYFSNISNQFPPFERMNSEVEQKIGLVGSVSNDRKILYYWFSWKDNTENTIELISESDLVVSYRDLQRKTALEGGKSVVRSVNLELSRLMGDSARQVVVDMVYDTIKEIVDEYKLFESDYILYERLCNQTKRISELEDKSLEEIAEWSKAYVQKACNMMGSNSNVMPNCVINNNANVINIMYISNYLVKKGATHESLSLPQPDLSYTSGWIWEAYSKDRVIERVKTFFLWKQISYHQMVEKSFPKMKEYFGLSKDYPYKYRIHILFKDLYNNKLQSEPLITYYRISIGEEESCMPEIYIDTQNEPYLMNETYFRQIDKSFHDNGKEASAASISHALFDMTLISHRDSSSTPLTEAVYNDLKESFEDLFE